MPAMQSWNHRFPTDLQYVNSVCLIVLNTDALAGLLVERN